MTRYPPWASFWFRSQHAELPEADLSRTPRELNPYERFLVRFAFAEWKVVALIVAGFAVGLPIAWLTGGRIIP